MKMAELMTASQRKVLEQARNTYGDAAQILVANEELCELAAVCAKFPRYETKTKAQEELYSHALDEVADVMVVLDHIVNIFGLKEEDLKSRIEAKIDRLSRWLDSSPSMEQTTVDRRVDEATPGKALCMTCTYQKFRQDDIGPCSVCHNYSEYKEKLPCKSCAHRGNYYNLKPGQRCLRCVESHGSLFEPQGGTDDIK